MNFSLVSSLLLVLVVASAYVSSSVVPDGLSLLSETSFDNDEQATSDELSEPVSLDEYSQEASEDRSPRVRRSCDCKRQSGECVAYATYQCSSRRNAVVVQCVGNNRWVRIGFCPNSCRILSNNQPYCF